jgi:hypothetical protein
MGLIDLKTDLKSLRYGRDRKGGGSSNQPYITTPIPDDLTANGPDFLLRQGALQASLDDVSRLTKWFSDPLSINGLLFTTKQIALERQNPKLIGINRIYLPTSTISQVGLNALGAHLNKQGLDPFGLGYAQGGRRGYYYSTRNQALPSGELENRLTIAYTAKIANQDLGSLTINPFGITNVNPNVLLSYSGGPNAPLGLGTTQIKLAGDGSGSPRDRTNTYNLIAQSNVDRVYSFDNSLFSEQTPFIESKLTTLSSITDYRQIINTKLGNNPTIPETNYFEFNREKTYKTSTTRYRLVDPSRLTNPNNSVSIDEINALDVQTTNTAQGEEENNNQAITNIINYSDSDLIKFFFEVINPNTVESVDYLFFRAYINSIGDNFKGEWQPYRYLGRAESFYKYGGFSRDVQLSFIIYAHSRAEMKPLYKKLNRLVGTTSPRYSGRGYMLGNFVRLTVGTYFSNVPGIINSISLKPSFEAGWDINRNTEGLSFKPEDEDNYLGQIPRMIEVDLSFTPIHDFAPRYEETFINNEPVELTPPTPSPAVTPNSIDTPTSTPPPPPPLPSPAPINFANPVTSNLNQILNPGLGSGVLFP